MSDEEVTRVKPTEKRGGTWLRIGDEEYRIPALGFFDLQELEADIAVMGGIKPGALLTKEQFEGVARIITTAMQRNYPEMQEVTIRKMIDLSNFMDVLSVVLNNSGLRKSATRIDGGGEVPGETKASTGA